jgi:hypothetical protein
MRIIALLIFIVLFGAYFIIIWPEVVQAEMLLWKVFWPYLIVICVAYLIIKIITKLSRGSK